MGPEAAGAALGKIAPVTGPAPTEGLRIRPGRPVDAPALAALRYEFRGAHAPPVEGKAAFLARCARWMEARLRPGSGWQCWVADDGGEIRGQVWIGVIEKLPNPSEEAEEHAYLTNFYVSEGLRGQGAGGRLLDAALAWCRERGVGSVVLWASERSRSLYLRRGFRARGRLLELIAEPGPRAGPFDGGNGAERAYGPRAAGSETETDTRPGGDR